MKPLLHLEEFVDPAAAQIEEAEAEGDAAEQGRLAAYEQGIVVAKTRGDLQAAREMTVFARRLRRQLAADQP